MIGRILNRFSKDIGTIDNELSGKLHSTFDVITDIRLLFFNVIILI